jgi:hypothetical protein
VRVRLPGPVDVEADGESRPVSGARRKAVLALWRGRPLAVGVAQPLLRATRRLQLTGTTALRRTKGWGAVLAALVSGLVLRSLGYTVTASRPAAAAAV